MFTEVVTHLGDATPDFVLKLVVVLFVPVVTDLEFTEHGVVGLAVEGFGLSRAGKEGRKGGRVSGRSRMFCFVALVVVVVLFVPVTGDLEFTEHGV